MTWSASSAWRHYRSLMKSLRRRQAHRFTLLDRPTTGHVQMSWISPLHLDSLPLLPAMLASAMTRETFAGLDTPQGRIMNDVISPAYDRSWHGVIDEDWVLRRLYVVRRTRLHMHRLLTFISQYLNPISSTLTVMHAFRNPAYLLSRCISQSSNIQGVPMKIDPRIFVVDISTTVGYWK